MRTLLLPALFVGLLGGVGRSLAQDETRAILDKALKAHGGEERLAKVKAAQSKTRGVLHAFGGVKFTSESFVQLPNQMKNEMKLEVNGMNFTTIQVLNGDKGWLSVNGATQELDDKLLKEMKEDFYAQRLASLTLLKEKDYQLTPLGAIKVDGKDAIGIRVASQGHRDVNLYFDKDSGLLVKLEHRYLDVMNNQEGSQEELFSDYKEYEGIKRPTKAVILRDGKKFAEAEVIEVKLLDKLDPNTFARP